MKDKQNNYQYGFIELVELNHNNLYETPADIFKSRRVAVEISDICNDVFQELCRYRALKNHKISRHRRLDLSALEELVANPAGYFNRESCVATIRQRVTRIKTPWYRFSKKSQLRNMILEILIIHDLPQLKKARDDLEAEMRSHEDIAKLRSELTKAKRTIEILKQKIGQEVKEKPEATPLNNNSNNGSFFKRLFK